MTVVSVYSYGLTHFSLFKYPILSSSFSIFLPTFHSLSFSLPLSFSFPPSFPPSLPPSLSLFLISQVAEEWLKREDPFAFQLRDEIMRQYGLPASPIRPEVTSNFLLPFLFSIYLNSNVHKQTFVLGGGLNFFPPAGFFFIVSFLLRLCIYFLFSSNFDFLLF